MKPIQLLAPWVYKHRLNRLRKARAERFGETNSRLLLITSRDTDTAITELKAARVWSKDQPPMPTVIITPQTAWNAIDDLPSHWRPIVYAVGSADQFDLPTKDIVDQLLSRPVSHSLLLPRHADLFTLFLFDVADAQGTAVFESAGYEGDANLLVSPAPDTDDLSAIRYFFNCVDNFL